MSKVLPILSKAELLALLPATTQPVKLLRTGDSAVKITPEHALLLVSRGTFAGEGSPKRIKKIWEIEPTVGSVGAEVERKSTPWTLCYRTLDSACLPPSVEWLNTRLSGG